MTVCACQNISLEDVVDAMELLGDDPEAIREKTCIGKGCEECLDTACENVDLPFPYALLNARAILNQR
jgi:bacterioferritin-associated ferredoxin